MRLGLPLLLVAGVQSLSIPVSHVVHERREVHPQSQWVKGDRLSADVVLPMRVGMTQSGLEKGEDLLMDVSMPGSSNYAQHMTAEEVIEFFAPSEKAIDTVRQWLVDSGIASHRIKLSSNKQWFAFDATTEEAEDLLHTQYHEFELPAIEHIAPACDEYHVPKKIQPHIDYITPGIGLIPHVAKKRMQRSINEKRQEGSTDFAALCTDGLNNCDQCVSPACIAALYDIPPGNLSDPSNVMGVFEVGPTYNQADLDNFTATFVPQIPQGTFPQLISIDGGVGPVENFSLASGEANLDFDLAIPILWPQLSLLYQVNDAVQATQTQAFNNFLDALDGSYCTFSAFGETGDNSTIDAVYPDTAENGFNSPEGCGVFNSTNVISVSYGSDEVVLPERYMLRQCHEYMKLGLQGVSIFFASGDNGVAAASESNDNTCLGADSSIFSPSYPASCPWVVTVGATQINPGSTVNDAESVANGLINNFFASGGGFSNLFSIPQYQQAALYDYYSQHAPPYGSYSRLATADGSVSLIGLMQFNASFGLFNNIGRGFPDVSANGNLVATTSNGALGVAAGTSAATPIFAAIINRINEERIAVGKKPVGFINPVLYANPQMLNDITTGHSAGCGTDGFAAVPGWDPVSGLGTPNYPAMLEVFMSLP